jgi:hypothetical protein
MNKTERKCTINKKKSNVASVREKPLTASSSDKAMKEETVILVRKRKWQSETERLLPGKRQCGVKPTRRRPPKRKCPRNKKKSNASPARKKLLSACASDTAQKKKHVTAVRKRKVRSESVRRVSGKRQSGAKTTSRKSLKGKCPSNKKKPNALSVRKKRLPSCTSKTAQEKKHVSVVRKRKVVVCRKGWCQIKGKLVRKPPVGNQLKERVKVIRKNPMLHL